ncbi:MAG: UDP-4-amino-4,6-dideoxy-N-acetyl-beta-L-altrosamine transaminase [Candidatus Omnitrophota bacterium]
MRVIPYGKQFIDRPDITAAVKVLKSSWLTQGPKIGEFERRLSECCRVKYAVAVSSGTAALHLAALAAGLKKGDEAITSPITFLATPNAVLYSGAKPVFADIDEKTVNINPEEIKRHINKKTKAVLPVHFAGLPCEMESIYAIAKKNNLIIIEDACHALGAKYKAGTTYTNVGSCRHSDMTVFSFHPVKHITTGEGGAITTNNKNYYKKLLALRNHGMYKDKNTAKRGPWYYEMRDLGFNYRITDFQCALGLSQLKKINSFIRRRRQIAAVYNQAFGNIESIEVPYSPKNSDHAYHLYVLKIDFKQFNTTRSKFSTQLKKRGILTQVHYIPIYHQPFYCKSKTCGKLKFKISEAYYKKAISIPIYPAMTDGDVRRVISSVRELL